MRAFVKWVVVLSVGLTTIALVGYLLVVYGVIRLNYPSRILYPVHGVDVSHHQGEIDWELVKDDGYDFAIIKATEGGDWKDTKYSQNVLSARENDVVVCSYHYYSFCKDPVLQANHFISVIGDLSGSLPPAIDIEFDQNCNGALPVLEFRKNLLKFVAVIVEEYGVYPIIYCNEDFFFKYLDAKEFLDCDFWIRNVVSQPDLNGKMWSFWQYTAKGKVSGITGLTDLNVYSGRTSDFEELIIP